MAYCRKCGAEIDDEAVICPKCGVPQNVKNNQTGFDDDGNNAWLVIGFLFPLIGLILYLLWNGTKPLNAGKAGTGALWGVIVTVILSFILLCASM